MIRFVKLVVFALCLAVVSGCGEEPAVSEWEGLLSIRVEGRPVVERRARVTVQRIGQQVAVTGMCDDDPIATDILVGNSHVWTGELTCVSPDPECAGAPLRFEWAAVTEISTSELSITANGRTDCGSGALESNAARAVTAVFFASR